MRVYKGIVRPLLFRFSSERAHSFALKILGVELPWRCFHSYFEVMDKRLNVNLGGIRLRNPVGLAAGFNKDCEALEGLMHLGFGYVVPGSIVRHPRARHPLPYLLRYRDISSLINCMGVPGKGLEYSLARLRKVKARTVPLIANICCFSIEEYLESYERLAPLVDGVEIGLICPHEEASARLGQSMVFSQLAQELSRIKRGPLFVKIGHHDKEKDKLVEICLKNDVDGLTISGTRIVPEPRVSMKKGSLSGKAVWKDTLRMIRYIYRRTGGAIPIKASGGIFSGLDALRAIAAGATTIEIYTSLVYEGPGVARQINLEILRLLEENNIGSINELRGKES